MGSVLSTAREVVCWECGCSLTRAERRLTRDGLCWAHYWALILCAVRERETIMYLSSWAAVTRILIRRRGTRNVAASALAIVNRWIQDVPDSSDSSSSVPALVSSSSSEDIF